MLSVHCRLLLHGYSCQVWQMNPIPRRPKILSLFQWELEPTCRTWFGYLYREAKLNLAISKYFVVCHSLQKRFSLNDKEGYIGKMRAKKPNCRSWAPLGPLKRVEIQGHQRVIRLVFQMKGGFLRVHQRNHHLSIQKVSKCGFGPEYFCSMRSRWTC